MDKKLKVAWLHNYSANHKSSAAGVFMFQLFETLRKQPDIEIQLFNIGTLFNPIKVFIRFRKLRKTLKNFDILHAQYGSGTGFFTSLFPQKKVLSLRGSDWYITPSQGIKRRFHIYLGNALTKLSLKKYDKIVTMSERMKYEVIEQFSNLNIEVIPDGIDLNKFKQTTNKKQNKFRILFSSVCRDNPIKRYDLAMQAYQIFKKKYPNSELVLMTNVPHNQVKLVIESSNLILLTSTHEGWPNIIKEGLACNVPFVSTDVSDLKKIANKTNNCFVCDDNSQNLAEAIEKSYLAKEDLNLRSLMNEFEIKKIAKEIIDLYQTIYP